MDSDFLLYIKNVTRRTDEYQIIQEFDSQFDQTKETKGRSSGQTPFTIKPKQLALKKAVFN